MRKLILALALVTLSGCSTIANIIPSFWDDNQSARIIDVRLSIDSIDCSQTQLAQALRLQDQLKWFELYSESKGRRQQDVIKIITPMQESVMDWVKRSQEGQGSQNYCLIKKKLLQSQAKTAASAVLGRF
jgi:hypothetical protein